MLCNPSCIQLTSPPIPKDSSQMSEMHATMIELAVRKGPKAQTASTMEDNRVCSLHLLAMSET